jgi:hypothetical protein
MNSTRAMVMPQEGDGRARAGDWEAWPKAASGRRWFRYEIGSLALEEQACARKRSRRGCGTAPVPRLRSSAAVLAFAPKDRATTRPLLASHHGRGIRL